MARLNVFETPSLIVHHIKGDYVVDGYIDNMNRLPYLEVVAVDGKIYEVEDLGYVGVKPLKVRESDDNIEIVGSHITFSPNDGELTRAGYVRD